MTISQRSQVSRITLSGCSPNVFLIVFLLVMPCHLITLIKCLKGHKHLASEWVIVSDLEIGIACPSFASLFSSKQIELSWDVSFPRLNSNFRCLKRTTISALSICSVGKILFSMEWSEVRTPTIWFYRSEDTCHLILQKWGHLPFDFAEVRTLEYDSWTLLPLLPRSPLNATSSWCRWSCSSPPLCPHQKCYRLTLDE